jgi:hypothetical protein
LILPPQFAFRETITMTHGRASITVAAAAAIVIFCSLGVGQDQPKVGFTDTPMLPGGKWHVHDGNRPIPAIITPGTCSTQEKAGSPPSDAVVLFDGTDLSHWRGRSGKPAPWKIDDGSLVIAERSCRRTSSVIASSIWNSLRRFLLAAATRGAATVV